ncbi:MAG: GNAT family N-acetyltransferase [Bacteriovoracaceae bacterium]|jgi:predicted GNAT family N-acyltransferase|nr:GNAT family N-acetyltransferase [Bacteriovoracaceae bacterium]
MEVKRISASDTYCLRGQILRPGRDLSSCKFEGDNDELTFHLGAFIDNKLVSVASFYFDQNSDLNQGHQYRLRGMATLEEFRRKGLSKSLLKTAFPIIIQNQCQLVWCNARVSAQGFYESIGFEKFGESFDISQTGPHQLMFKKIP